MSTIKKLSKTNIEDIMSLTSTQEGLLFHYRSSSTSDEYHEQLSLKIEGEVELDIVQKAWDFVIQSNEMLRTIFKWDKLEKNIQIVLKNHKSYVEYYDFSHLDDVEKKLEKLKRIDIENRIDITKETIRIKLCKLKKQQYEMIISNHHILYDGWSNGIILREFMEAYIAFYNGEEPSKLNKTKFKEFIKWQKSEDKLKQRQYWEEYLKGIEVNNNIVNSHDGKCIRNFKYEFSNEFTQKIKNFSKNNNISLADMLYSSWAILLQKLNNCDDIIFGTTVSGRDALIKDINNIVGLFINTVPCRIRILEEEILGELIKKVHNSLIERNEYDNASIIDIKEYSNLKDIENIFGSIVVVENYPIGLNRNHLMSISEYSLYEVTNYNMTLSITTFSNITLNFSYNNFVTKDEYVKKFGKYMENILEAIIDSPNIKISELDILTKEEKNQILYAFNETKKEYTREKMIHQLFEEQVEISPDKVALLFKGQNLTYKELNERANRLAFILRKNGVGPESIVGIIAKRSVEMIVGILGILKAGGAYLPISPEYPKDRISYMIEDSKTNILLVQKEYINYGNYNCKLIDLNDEDSYSNNTQNLVTLSNTKNLVYVIYTSGSTGKPKGVMIENFSVVNRINWMQKNYPLYEEDIILQKTTYTFDVSVWELFWWFIAGSKLCLLEPGSEKDPKLIIQAIKENKITVIHFVPPMFNLFVDNVINLNMNNSLKTLKWIFTSGESLNVHGILKFQSEINRENNIQVVNLYGPTEATVDVTYYNCPKDIPYENIPIGKPIDNINIYILNKYNNIQPIGFVGELCIAGDGVARGYLNNEGLTKEKFITNPFNLESVIYKTGDLAKWLPDGNIEFLGRIDNQVKIRGFRIELGEIEKVILDISGVKDVVVINREDNTKNQYLCAYIVSEYEIKLEKFIEELSSKLPEYMIPAYFIKLDKLPLNINGKVNRKQLPIPDGSIISRNKYEAPRNEIEKKLSDIWSEMLDINKIGVNDNFFQLGGHSLKVTTLIAKIYKTFGLELTIKQVFDHPTIKEIGDIIQLGDGKKNTYNIECVEKKQYYNTSSAQKRMYMLDKLKVNSTIYNMTGALLILGKFDIGKLNDTVNKLINRHESLRTSFAIMGEDIVQIINDEVNLNTEYIEKMDKSTNQLIDEFIKPFNLEEAPLLRIGVVRVKEDEYILLINMHHIISDGISMNILIRDFLAMYEDRELKELKIQYKDYSEWQSDFFNSEEVKEQERYWLKTLSGEIPILNLPLDYVRPKVQSFEGESIEFKVDSELKVRLNQMANETGSTMFMVLLSAINILISKYSGQEDILIGIPISGRNHKDLENVMGVFVNTLVMRNYPVGTKSYKRFLNEVKENSIEAFENQDYQFEVLVDKLQINRDMGRNPLFDVMFSMENMDQIDVKTNELRITSYKHKGNTTKFDINFTATEIEKELVFNIEYCSKLFKKETIERMAESLISILYEVSHSKEINIKDIEIISEKEKLMIINDFNNTYRNYPRDKTISEIFEEQVEKTPTSVAVVCDEKTISYRELNIRANKLAITLRNMGVKPDSVVGVMVERSIDTIISLLAILKAGGAYVPIDTEHPKDRIVSMIKASNSTVLIIKGSNAENVFENCTIIDLEDENNYKNDGTNLECISNSKNLAYVMYTSGSLGIPKGVMVENRSVLRLVLNTNYVEFNHTDRILQTGTLSFDACTFEIWGALLNGLELHLGNKQLILNSLHLEKYMHENHITVLWLTAPLFGVLADERPTIFKGLKYLLVGGDVIPVKLVNKIRKMYSDVRIVNGYGPTENTTFSTCFSVDKEYDSNIPIGKPISNSKVYVLDKYNKLQPIGVYGELYVAGDGLARGYINNEELTKEKFVKNIFSSSEKMYKTGDLGRWLPSGDIEFHGRIDNQVKIRGFRIELQEIEKQLTKLDVIKEAVLIDYKDEGDVKYLCAYVVSDNTIIAKDIVNQLSEKLPKYMIPSYIIQVESIPLTLNGKVDRKMLPKPQVKNIISDYEGPRNEIEEILINIWSKLLNIKKVSINDNFFEIGGHSLKAISLIAMIYNNFNVEISLSDIFNRPTIKGLSNLIVNEKEVIYDPIKPVENRMDYETSPAQRRMYMLQQFNTEGINYNIPNVMVISGKVDLDKIEKTFRYLINRHESLRTSFLMKDTLIQRVSENVDFKIECIEKLDRSIDEIIDKFVKSFDLAVPPLLRVGIIETSIYEHILIIDIHHIISDGTSMEILLREFVEIYNDNELEELRIQYKDYAQWINSLLKSEKIRKQEEYWLKTFSDEVPILNLPLDFKRPPVQSYQGDSLSFSLDKELTSKLYNIALNTDSTIYMVILSCINILLSKYSGQSDIVIGSPVSGRNNIELEKIIGMFVNTIPMRNYPNSHKTYQLFLNEVKNCVVTALENKDYQFEQLVDKLQINRDSSRNSIFDVMFSMENMEMNFNGMNGLEIKQYKQKNKISKFDLSFWATKKNDEINMEIEYCTQLYKRETIEIMMRHFKSIIIAITNNINILIGDIEIITEKEKKLIFNNFNNTYRPYERNKVIHQLFEEQVMKTPNNVAVVYEDTKLTYKELNVKANKLAKILRNKGVKPETVVGMMVGRSLEMMIAIIGILKAGGAYLPIDSACPNDRIEYMLTDSDAKLLLIDNTHREELKFNGELINLENLELNRDDEECVVNVNKPEDLSYVIYTSGSTGRPKGVMVEHRNVVNLSNWYNKKYNLKLNKNVLQITNIAFDVAVLETILPVLNGGVVFIPNKDIFNKDEFREFVNKNTINTVQFVPATLNELIVGNEFMESLSILICGGDRLEDFLRDKVLSMGYELYNHYGPTETTVDTIVTKCDDKNIIGKPVDNSQVYILNDSRKLQGINVPGEIYIGGDGVTRGYLNRSELTEEKFMPNPFIEGGRIYKTGDLGRMLPDGNIEFLGRLDYQVKIRGLRIEIGEIESQLKSIAHIKEAIVINRERDNGSKYLCAYIISNQEMTIKEVRDELSKKLPEYMIPAYFVQLESIPLTQNGKIDRKALPLPDKNMGSGIEYEAPKNEIEKSLVDIWSKILGVDKIGVNDNFFTLGGDSLLLISMYKEIDKIYKDKIKVMDLFAYTTISKLADFITNNSSLKDINYLGIPFPKEYFLGDDVAQEKSRLEFVIKDEVYRELTDISQMYNIKMYEILLGVYVYLLAEVADEDKIYIHVKNFENNMIAPIVVNLDDIEDLVQLNESVANKLKNIEKKLLYSLDDVNISKINKKDYYVLPLVCNDFNIKEKYLRIYDLIINFTFVNNRIIGSCEYNSRINKIKITELISLYINMLKAMVKKLKK